MKKPILAAILFASFAIATFQTAYADDGGEFSLETGVNYNTGKYGNTQSTDMLYAPVTGTYKDKLWTLKVTVPYLQITGPTNVINGVGTVAATNSAITTRSGLGDVIMGATRSAYYDSESGILVNLTGKVKLGTASSIQGMGTGKNDYSIESGIYQVTESITEFGSVGYKVYGKPVGYTLNNIFYGSLGASYKFDQDTNGGMMLSFGQKSTNTGASRAEAIFFASQKLDRDLKVQGYMLKGFTNAVPNWGAGVTVAYIL